jgi:thioredoxin 1
MSKQSMRVAVLCAQWCGVCRTLRPDFEKWARQLGCPTLWIDVEDDAELLGDRDIENFPTLLVADENGFVHFVGPVLPQIETLQRMVTAALQAPLQKDGDKLGAEWMKRWSEQSPAV